jgi:predicted alpha/beta-fold hydrolase
LQDLLQPLVLGTPEPLTDTVPPQDLGDADSRWIEVDGISVHHKDVGPKAPGTPTLLLLHGFNGSVFSWSGPYFSLLNAQQLWQTFAFLWAKVTMVFMTASAHKVCQCA